MADEEKPRGYYKVEDNWKSNDDSQEYLPGFMNKTGWPLIKAAILVLIFTALRSVDICTTYSVLVCIGVTATYKDLVAKLTGKIRMSSMDTATFLCRLPNNIMSSTETDISCVD